MECIAKDEVNHFDSTGVWWFSSFKSIVHLAIDIYIYKLCFIRCIRIHTFFVNVMSLSVAILKLVWLAQQ